MFLTASRANVLERKPTNGVKANPNMRRPRSGNGTSVVFRIHGSGEQCANNKGVNRDEIPVELWENAPAARQLLCKMVRKAWTQIQEGRPIEIPEDWLDATLVCLYKGKGKRKDPAMHRGISLILMVEKIISVIAGGRENQITGGRQIATRTEWFLFFEVL